MARSQKQKLKLLYLMQYLTQYSDEAHPVGIAQMVEMLAAHGILAERKSLYGDLEALREFGLDVVQARGKTVGYYIGTRDFELPELKLLVDSVQSSKFITQRKTLALIRKIENLASVHEAAALQRQVYVRNRVKSMNESVYYNVDEISSAISADRKIRFLYFEYTVKKERRYRHDGAFYEVSPYALMWDDENYYMLAYEAAAGQIRHYRVDKMTQISVLESFRDEPPRRRGDRPLRPRRDAHPRGRRALLRLDRGRGQPAVLRLGLRLRRGGGDPLAREGARRDGGDGAERAGPVRREVVFRFRRTKRASPEGEKKEE